ncbi:lipopolysaccharide biosynthesis protein [Reinekea marinisedimentorum]|uniref:O-antigen/teichoic acid export membrane protein n=1 Tax=Reinekea marinisedimentorum TaxID=230495 RepID=A0A4R3ICN6_9GAMM|nr:oligosaccharide flippase family protein [Reinekea marinisedimentorum]TCS42375.1 O-antigen/teichoic acid export membrane protein [Reinekea marinisedimentorum]
MTHELKQMLYYGMGLFLMKGVSFLMLPVVANALSAEQFGQLDLWLSVLNIGSILVGFGLTEALYKQWGDSQPDQRNELISTATLQQAKIASYGFIVYLFASVAANHLLPQLNPVQLALASATLLVSALINIPLSWLRLQDSAGTFFLLTSGKALTQAAATFAFLHAGWGVTGILLSGFITSALLAIALILLQHRNIRWQWRAEKGRALVKYGWPLMCSGVLLFVAAGAERWILAATVGLAELAQYALAMQLAMIIAIACEPLTLWWFPKRFQMLKNADGEKRTARMGELVSHFCLWMVLLLSTVTPWLISELLPQRYSTVISILPWLALGMAFKQMSHLLNIGCYSGERPNIVFKINLVMAMIALTLFSAMSLWLGLQGVVITFVMLYALRALVFVRVSQGLLRLPYRFHLLIIHSLLVAATLFAGFTTGVMLLLCVGQTLAFFAWLLATTHELKLFSRPVKLALEAE